MSTAVGSRPEGPSLRSRVAIAVALTVTFYGLALVIGLGLVAAPVALWVAADWGNVWVALACFGAGFAILRAIVPQRARFEAPGPELTRADQPALFAVLDRLAERAGERPADHVHLDVDVNAAVLEQRGRRIMLLGLGLLACTDEDELEAIVAHELGHYAGGDTKLSRWVWRTRAALARTVSELSDSESWFRREVVARPFAWYAKLFGRITNAVSRREEFAADAFAARLTSPDAAARALRRVSTADAAFRAYWQHDVVPMLTGNHRPPIATGFRAMAGHERMAPALDEVLRAEIDERDPNPYASHPTLRQRLEALGDPADGEAPPPVERPAVDLLRDIDALERALLVCQYGEQAAQLDPAGWDVAAAVHLDALREEAARFGRAFGGDWTVGDAGRAAATPAAFRATLRGCLERDVTQQVPDAEIDDLAVHVLATLVVLAAADAGVEVTARPGEPVLLHADGAELQPWDLLPAIAAGQETVHVWKEDPVVVRLAARPLHVAPAAAS